MPQERVVVALIRPSPFAKPSTKSFKSKDYEVFLTVNKNSTQKQLCLPSFYLETDKKSTSEIRINVMEYVYEMTRETSQNNFGIKIKRVIFAKKHKIKLRGFQDEDAHLFVGATSAKHEQIISNDDAEMSAGFYCFYDCIKDSSDHSEKYVSGSKSLLDVYENWFKKLQLKPMRLQGLFRPSALERIFENVTNPAYAGDSSSDWTLLEYKINTKQIMDKMKSLNEADIIVYNPAFGTENNPHNKVDQLVINKFFMQKPDLSKIKIPDREEWFKGGDVTEDLRGLSWEDEFLLHRAAADGDIQAMVEILREDSTRSEMWDNDGWAPVHYACWYGQSNALALLLKAGCNPNICNRNQTSLLHLAAGCGHPDIIEILLNHPFIDKLALDKNGRTALACCEEIKPRDWQKCAHLLKEAMNKAVQTIVVKRMDNVDKKVKLLHGSNTTMQDVIDHLNLTEEAKKYFTIWITSKNLHLQLKPDHRPLIELQKWPTLLWTVGQDRKTDNTSVPELVLKRDVKLLPSVEEHVQDPFSIRLLYNEAYTQILQGLYPCSDEVAVALAAIIMRLNYGQIDTKKHKANFLNDKKLALLLPHSKLRNKMVNWQQKIITEYKELSDHNASASETHDLQLLYLRYCWTQIPLYGCAFFNGRIIPNKVHTQVVAVFIGVNYRGVHLIKSENMELLSSMSYHSLSWELNEEEYFLHLKSDKIDIILQTPQAALVSSLMTKLSVMGGKL